MCSAYRTLFLLGRRSFGAFWCFFQPVRWETTVRGWDGDLWWIWPLLGIVFISWTTIMFVLVAPVGGVGWDWLWIGLMLVAGMRACAGGYGRKRIPAYQRY